MWRRRPEPPGVGAASVNQRLQPSVYLGRFPVLEVYIGSSCGPHRSLSIGGTGAMAEEERGVSGLAVSPQSFGG